MIIKLDHHRVILSEKPAEGGKVWVWITPHGPYKTDGMQVTTDGHTREYRLPADLKLKKIKKIFYMPPELAQGMPPEILKGRTWWSTITLALRVAWIKGRRKWYTIKTWVSPKRSGRR